MKIRREDVEYVRERSRIDEVVGEHVTLRSAGVGSLKGLCPFHDERTPSFHVRPQVGFWHCFGCGEGGDVISFVQKVDALGFAEAVERLAARLGYALQYEDDAGGRGAGRREETGRRQRLVEANRAAAQYYVEQLVSPEAEPARRFLRERGFDAEAAERFGVGFAPRSGEALVRHLRGRGVTEDELLAAGLAAQGQRGHYDRFRGRLLWPIRDVTGDVVGFGARRIFDDDRIEAKYLNTPETALYKKSQVLYGVDLAKREIARTRRVVVVEGYTDVMACHLAGVGSAVATCGTAFAADHIRVVRRLLGDEQARGGEVIFTFDGDAAGRKAAMRAFEEDQRFVAQTFVAVARDGMDPCDLRLARGDEAVRALVDGRQPLFEFALRTTIADFDLDTQEGRLAALDAAAPIVGSIRDAGLRDRYAVQLDRWLGFLDEAFVRRRLARAQRTEGSGPGSGGPRDRGSGSGAAPRPAGPPRGSGRPGGPAARGGTSADPVTRAEREALECLLQVPHLVPIADADGLGEEAFTAPAHRAVHAAVRAAGGLALARTVSAASWAERVREQAPEAVAPMITELAVAPLPAHTEGELARYAGAVVLRVAEMQLVRRIGTLRARVERLPSDDDGALEAMTELMAAEGQRRTLRERMVGE